LTRHETIELLAVLQAAYHRFYADTTQKQRDEAVSVWNIMLSDIPLEVAKLALYRLIATLKFPPTIAEMRESIATVRYEPLPDAGDAWGEVNQAIKRYGGYREKEALESLREPVRSVVQRMGWQELCTSENDIADRAHFLRIYEAMERRTHEHQQLPRALRERIGQAKSTLALCT